MKESMVKMTAMLIAAINVGSLVQAFLLPSNPLGSVSSVSTSCSSPRACGVIMRADLEDGTSMMKPMDRKVALQSAVLTLGAALVVNPSTSVAEGVDFSKVTKMTVQVPLFHLDPKSFPACLKGSQTIHSSLRVRSFEYRQISITIS